MTPDEFIRTYETSTRSHGLERTLSLFDGDAVYWFSDGTSHQGKSAIEWAIRHNFGTIENEDYRISDIQWVAQSADVAVCIYRFDWSAGSAGRGTSVLIHKGDSWRVVHEHLSKGPTRGGNDSS